MIVILRRVGFPPRNELKGGVFQPSGGREDETRVILSPIEPRQIDKGLEKGTRLSTCLIGPIKLAHSVIPPSDQRQDGTVRGTQRHKRSLERTSPVSPQYGVPLLE